MQQYRIDIIYRHASGSRNVVPNVMGYVTADKARKFMEDVVKTCRETFPNVGVATINMDVAPVDAGLGDVRPSSSGPISFGVRTEDKYSVCYSMAEPIQDDSFIMKPQRGAPRNN